MGVIVVTKKRIDVVINPTNYFQVIQELERVLGELGESLTEEVKQGLLEVALTGNENLPEAA